MMKFLIVIAFALCLGFAALAFIVQSRWETRVIQRSAELQANITETGLKHTWLETLADAIDRGELPPGYMVELDPRLA